jgi:RNA polymerase sigma-70 factor (ECF subfamily)
MLSALRHFISDARDSAGAQKRGGGQQHISPDESFATLAAPGSESPEQAFTRHWMKTVIERATRKLEREAASAGKQELYRQLNGFLGEKPDASVYKALGEKLGMRPNTIAVGVHRMRLRLRELVREELLQTVADSASLDEELRELRATFADPFNGD